MKKLFPENTVAQFIFLSLVVFLSRLPFLSAGYGSEEDAWLLPLTAKNIALSGRYELSRAPGHPLQEIIYSRQSPAFNPKMLSWGPVKKPSCV